MRQHVLGIVEDREPQLEAVLLEVDARKVAEVGGHVDHAEQERGQVLRDCAEALKKSSHESPFKLDSDKKIALGRVNV